MFKSYTGGSWQGKTLIVDEFVFNFGKVEREKIGEKISKFF